MKAQRRGKNLALAGAVLETVFTIVLLVVALWTGSKAAMSCMWFLAGGVAVWLMAALLFYCRQLEIQESTELAEIAAMGEQAASIFRGERDLSLRPAAARLRFVERWIVPGFTAALAAWHAGIGAMVLLKLRPVIGAESPPAVTNLAQGLMFTVLVGFAAFLFSRYATGMGSRGEWRPLRAPASYLLFGALAAAGVAGAFVAAWWGRGGVDLGVALVLPGVQFVLAVELLISFVLDLYRPRAADQEHRLSFDSRLLNLLAEPGRVGHSIAETLNYQFGFEVSRTWFYRLLSKAFLPLVIFGAAVLVAMSSIVIVYQGRQCVVLHWGRRDAGRLLGPGLHVKWPWPVDQARHFDVGQIHEVLLGVGGAREPEIVNGRELMLWTTTHGRYAEQDFLLAIPATREGRAAEPATRPTALTAGKEAPPPVNIIKLVVSVQYQIEDVYKFGYRFVDAAKLLEAAAHGQMVRYCASATLDSEVAEGGGDRPEAIMTFGWGKAARALEQRVQQAVGPEGIDLGVRIVRVKFVSVHPPASAAPAFEEVLKAEREQDTRRYEAEGKANRTLSQMAGDPTAALELALACRQVLELESLAGQRSTAGDFNKALAGYLRRAEEDLAMLREEIRREALLGKLGGGQGTAKEYLAARHAEHLALLRKVPAEGAKFDYAGSIAAARDRADELFNRAAGEPAKLVAGATAYRWKREMDERARAEAFGREMLAFQASPNMYMLDRWYEVWDAVLPNMVKYVLGVDRRRVEPWLNWERRTDVLEGVFQGQGESEK